MTERDIVAIKMLRQPVQPALDGQPSRRCHKRISRLHPRRVIRSFPYVQYATYIYINRVYSTHAGLQQPMRNSSTSQSTMSSLHGSAGKHLDPGAGTAFGKSPYENKVHPAAAIPNTASKYATPSTAPRTPKGPGRKPAPVLIFVSADQPRTPASTRYAIPSAAPSAPPGPGGSPQPVRRSVISE